MMKNSKKILSLLLAIVICLCPMQIAMATDITDPAVEITQETTIQPPTTQPTTSEPTTSEPSTSEPTTTQPSTSEPTTSEPTTSEPTTTQPSTSQPTTEPAPLPPQESQSDTVAKMYVCFIRNDGHPFGHFWIYIENLTDKEMTLGHYTVPAHEGMSAGLLCRDDGWGIYYNVEAYSQTTYGMNGHIAMWEELNSGEVNSVSNALLKSLNHWDPFLNCMLFAFKVWNAGSSRKLIPLIFPALGKLQMKFHSYTYDLTMKPMARENVYRQKGSQLVLVSDSCLGMI